MRDTYTLCFVAMKTDATRIGAPCVRWVCDPRPGPSPRARSAGRRRQDEVFIMWALPQAKVAVANSVRTMNSKQTKSYPARPCSAPVQTGPDLGRSACCTAGQRMHPTRAAARSAAAVRVPVAIGPSPLAAAVVHGALRPALKTLRCPCVAGGSVTRWCLPSGVC